MKQPQSEYDGYEDFDAEDAYLRYYNPNYAWDRKSIQFVVIPVILAAATLIYHLSYLRFYRFNSPLDIFWDLLVYVLPARLLLVVDNWLNPPMFPRPSAASSALSHAAKSELLSKLLGRDKPGRMMSLGLNSGRALSSTNFTGGFSFGADKTRPPGLGNWDNSCYQNSILQGLASLEPLPAYLASALQNGNTKRSHPETVETLQALIQQLNDVGNNGKTLWTPGKLKSMSTWQQQDAQEYFSKILDDVDQEIAKLVKLKEQQDGAPSFDSDGPADETTASQHSDDSGYHSMSTTSKSSTLRAIHNPLEGLVAQRVGCTKCSHSDGLSMIPFNCLTLNLDVDRMEYDIYERLDAYSKLEEIEGVECGKCTLLKVRHLLQTIIKRNEADGMPESSRREAISRLEAVDEALDEDEFDDKTITEKCKIPPRNKVTTTKTKQTVLARLPQSLAIHINRSVFDERTGSMFKNLGAVRFPQTLDIGPWCLGSNQHFDDKSKETPRSADGKTLAMDEERWILDPIMSMNAGSTGQSRVVGPIYELKAIITHVGRHENGHYICYRNIAKPDLPTNSPRQASDENTRATQDHDGDGGSTPLDNSKIDGRSEPDEEESRNEWWRFSDETVYRVTEETVLAQGGVFMLFYDCVDPLQEPVASGDSRLASEAVPELSAVSTSTVSPSAAWPVSPSTTTEQTVEQLSSSPRPSSVGDITPLTTATSPESIQLSPVVDTARDEAKNPEKNLASNHPLESPASESTGPRGVESQAGIPISTIANDYQNGSHLAPTGRSKRAGRKSRKAPRALEDYGLVTPPPDSDHETIEDNKWAS